MDVLDDKIYSCRGNRASYIDICWYPNLAYSNVTETKQRTGGWDHIRNNSASIRVCSIRTIPNKLVSPSIASEQPPLRRSRYSTAASRDGPSNSIKSTSSKQFFYQTSKTRSLICAPGSLCMSLVSHHKLHTFNNSFLATARYVCWRSEDHSCYAAFFWDSLVAPGGDGLRLSPVDSVLMFSCLSCGV
jgi:hypothetical protein